MSRSFKVPHPEYITIGPNGRTVVIFHNDGGASFLDMLLITGIDFWPAPTAGGEANPTE